MAHLKSISLDNLIDNTTNRRVKRHLITTRNTLGSESRGDEIDKVRKLADSGPLLQRGTEFRKYSLEKTLGIELKKLGERRINIR